jgi:hypothetical protein
VSGVYRPAATVRDPKASRSAGEVSRRTRATILVADSQGEVLVTSAQWRPTADGRAKKTVARTGYVIETSPQATVSRAVMLRLRLMCALMPLRSGACLLAL